MALYCTADLPAPNTTATYTTLTVSGTIRSLRRMMMTGTTTQGVIYGGRYSGGINTNFYRYSIAGNTATITALTISGITPAAVSASAMVGDATTGIIFGGGRSDTITRSNTFYRFVVSGNTVTVTQLSLSGSISPRYGHAMVGNATTGIIFGGTSDDGSGHFLTSNDFFRYTVSGANVSVTRLTVTGTIPRRINPGMVGDATTGLVMGGRTNTSPFDTNMVHRYVVSGNNVTVTAMTLAGSVPAAGRNPRFSGTATTGILFGPRPGAQTVSSFHRYDVEGTTITFTSMSHSGTFTPRRTTTMTGDGNTVVMFGGRTAAQGYTNDFIRIAAPATTPVPTLQEAGGVYCGSNVVRLVFCGDEVVFGRRPPASEIAFTSIGNNVSRADAVRVGSMDSGLIIG